MLMWDTMFIIGSPILFMCALFFPYLMLKKRMHTIAALEILNYAAVFVVHFGSLFLLTASFVQKLGNADGWNLILSSPIPLFVIFITVFCIVGYEALSNFILEKERRAYVFFPLAFSKLVYHFCLVAYKEILLVSKVVYRNLRSFL